MSWPVQAMQLISLIYKCVRQWQHMHLPTQDRQWSECYLAWMTISALLMCFFLSICKFALAFPMLQLVRLMVASHFLPSIWPDDVYIISTLIGDTISLALMTSLAIPFLSSPMLHLTIVSNMQSYPLPTQIRDHSIHTDIAHNTLLYRQIMIARNKHRILNLYPTGDFKQCAHPLTRSTGNASCS